MGIGVSKGAFSDKLLDVINEKKRFAGLGELSFSDQLNSASTTHVLENVLVREPTRPNGRRCSSILSENNVTLKDGMFTLI